MNIHINERDNKGQKTNCFFETLERLDFERHIYDDL